MQAARSGGVHRPASGELIEGGAGPFYIALSRQTFYLLAAIFASLAPLVLYLVRDASIPVHVVVILGVSMESGTLAHIYLERIRRSPVLLGWAAHAAVTAALFAMLAALLLR